MNFEQRLDILLSGVADAPRDAILVSRLVFRVAHLLETHIDAALAPSGLRMRQYLALALLSGAPSESLTPSELGITLDATRTQITRLLDGLEAQGLVLRRHSTLDRRSLDLSVTDAGQTLLAQVRPVVHGAYVQAWAVLDAQGLGSLGALLREVNQHLMELCA